LSLFDSQWKCQHLKLKLWLWIQNLIQHCLTSLLIVIVFSPLSNMCISWHSV